MLAFRIKQALILDLFGFRSPLVEVVDGVRVVDMNARNVAHFLRPFDFLVDEVVVKIDVSCIDFGVGVEDAFHASPAECTQTHGAGFATAVDDAFVELEVVVHGAGSPDGIDLGMRRGVVVECDGVAASGYDLTIFDDNSTEWAASAINVLAGNVACHFDELAVLLGDDCWFHVNKIIADLISCPACRLQCGSQTASCLLQCC